MLVLTRKVGERIRVGDSVVLTVVAVQGQRIRLGIEAPDSVRIRRGELPSLPAGSTQAPSTVGPRG